MSPIEDKETPVARCPFAIWRGSPNENPGAMVAEPFGVVFHVMQGTLVGTEGEFSNAAKQKSSHFGVDKQGKLDQFVDTADKAWAEVGGNSFWWSIEHEGLTGDSLTPEQIATDARLIAWLRTITAFPLQLTDDPNGRGLGWHGMGGAAWGNHPNCPGEPIKANRQDIINLINGGIFNMLNDAEQAELLQKTRELHKFFLEPVGDVNAGVPWAVNEILNDVRDIKSKTNP
jgi:N-acetylmuramoyl-L-alanine amidase